MTEHTIFTTTSDTGDITFVSYRGEQGTVQIHVPPEADTQPTWYAYLLVEGKGTMYREFESPDAAVAAIVKRIDDDIEAKEWSDIKYKRYLEGLEAAETEDLLAEHELERSGNGQQEEETE